MSRVRPPLPAVATLDNTATYTATNAPGGSASASIIVQCPDVTVLKTASPSTISAGTNAIFTITVTNLGPGIARGVTLSDPLPAGFAWTENSASCSITTGTLNCNIGDLADQGTFSVTLTAPTTFAQCGTITNTATVAATNEPAAATVNNTSTATISINCSAIVVTKTPDAASVSAGTPIGFLITVTNTGEGTATGVTLSDTLPTNGGLAWTIDAGGNAANCSITAGVLNCQFGDLASGASRTVHISSPTTAATCGNVNNTATVTSTNAPNASGSGSVTVLCPNVTVTKTASSPHRQCRRPDHLHDHGLQQWPGHGHQRHGERSVAIWRDLDDQSSRDRLRDYGRHARL